MMTSRDESYDSASTTLGSHDGKMAENIASPDMPAASATNWRRESSLYSLQPHSSLCIRKHSVFSYQPSAISHQLERHSTLEYAALSTTETRWSSTPATQPRALDSRSRSRPRGTT